MPGDPSHLETLAYVHRLLREEDLFYWWEHASKGEQGSYTLAMAGRTDLPCLMCFELARAN